jgi:hypothetical protein
MKSFLLIFLLIFTSTLSADSMYLNWGDFNASDLIYYDSKTDDMIILTSNKSKNCPSNFHIAKKLPYQFLNKPSKAIENLCYRVDKDNNVLLRNDSLISFVTNKLLLYKFTSVGDFFVAINRPRRNSGPSGPIPMNINGELKLCTKIGEILDCD